MHLNIIVETNRLRLENECEWAALIDKSNGKLLMEDDFYGDPKCGLIDPNNKWAIVAGEHLTIWTPEKWQRIEDSDLQWIHSLRVKDHGVVEILIDPWSSNSSIWELDIKTFKYEKIRDFNDYKDREYADEVEW
jgi:hypothetical protein